MMTRILRGLALGSLAAAALVFAACLARTEATPPTTGEMAAADTAVPVTAAAVVQKSISIETDAVGTAEAYSTVAVHAQITGTLMAVHFTDGDDVAKGQLLFVLDRRPLEAALRQAEASLDRDLAQAANARAQLKRYQDLAGRGIATREQVDQNATNATALDATVAADRAAIENAKVQLEYATIVAPIAGRTGKLMVHAGNLVRANDATPIVVINQLSPIHVSFALPEVQLADFRRYQARGPLYVEARTPGTTGRSAGGRISFIDNAVDPSTGTIAIRATFPNSDRALLPGQFVNVTIRLGTDPNAIVIPSAAVQNGQQGEYVFVIKPDQTVEMRTVNVARTSGTEAVVTSGVKAGEMVVTDGQLRLRPGMRISIRTAAVGQATS